MRKIPISALTLVVGAIIQLGAGHVNALCDGTPNGSTEGLEECDDSNLESGDGCSDTCEVEDGFVCNQSADFETSEGTTGVLLGQLGGSSRTPPACPAGDFLIGLSGTFGTSASSSVVLPSVRTVDLICGSFGIDPATGDATQISTNTVTAAFSSAGTLITNEGSWSISCPGNEIVTGVLGNAGAQGNSTSDLRGFNNVGLQCGTLNVTGTTTVVTPGTSIGGAVGDAPAPVEQDSNCGVNEVANGFGTFFGFAIVDGVEVSCVTIKTSLGESVCFESCGNGIIDGSDQCDDAGESATCNADCTRATCGDGVFNNAAGEECDAAGESASCDNDCTLVECGDGNQNISAGEECDDGNNSTGDGCNAACKVERIIEVCGDGIVTANEVCDDGNTTSGDGCSDTCETEPGFVCNLSADPTNCDPLCGDGIIVSGEECDDQNVVDGDGCSTSCTIEPGFVCENQPSECRPTEGCGNGVVDFGEACDDGNVINGDGCSTECVVEPDWYCAPGSPSLCTPIPPCGDGVLSPGEFCDDGNFENGDGCNQFCIVEPGWDCVCENAGSITIDADDLGSTGFVGGFGGSYQGLVDCPAGTVVTGVVLSYMDIVAKGTRAVESMELQCTPTSAGGAGAVIYGGTTVTVPVFDGSGTSAAAESVICPADTYLVGFNATGGAMNATPGDNRGFDCVEALCAPAAIDALQNVTFGTPVAVAAGECGSGIIQQSNSCDEDSFIAGVASFGAVLYDRLDVTCNKADASCNNAPSVCTFTGARECGDGIVDFATGEECDDGNAINGDGCNASCEVESGWGCLTDFVNGTSDCQTFCGDGLVRGAERCDDGNITSGDGCSDLCVVEDDCTCSEASPSACICGGCGNGILEDGESCDDGNLESEDGCSVNCTIEEEWFCDVSVAPSQCTPVPPCGNSALNSGEFCDDGNVASGDGCSENCIIEDGFVCTCENPGGFELGAADTSGTGVMGAIGGTFRGDQECPTGFALTGLTVGYFTASNGNTMVQGIDMQCTEAVADGAGVIGHGAGASIVTAFSGSATPNSTETLACATDEFVIGITGLGGAMNASSSDLRGFDTLSVQCASASISGTTIAFGTPSSVTSAITGSGQVQQGVSCPEGQLIAAVSTHGQVIYDRFEPRCASASVSCLNALSICTELVDCGDGDVTGAEECDDGNNEDGDGCSSICVNEVCGDSIVQQGLDEQCDDGNTEDNDGCSSTCVREVCGDGVTQGALGETCDDGNLEANDGCSPECRLEVCGDGIVQGSEECDSRNEDTQECNADCTLSRCGDGYPNTAAGETCDDGNENNDDFCTNECALNIPDTCGDGIVDAGEECDAGGETADCNVNCTNTACGDGYVNSAANEECDTGDESPSCTDQCTISVCGDSIINTSAGEECDDGNTADIDGCSSTCMIEGCTITNTCDLGDACDNNDDCIGDLSCGDENTCIAADCTVDDSCVEDEACGNTDDCVGDLICGTEGLCAVRGTSETIDTRFEITGGKVFGCAQSTSEGFAFLAFSVVALGRRRRKA